MCHDSVDTCNTMVSHILSDFSSRWKTLTYGYIHIKKCFGDTLSGQENVNKYIKGDISPLI